MNTSDTTSSVEDLVAGTLDCPAKEYGSGFTTVGELGSPERYLYWQFPDWMSDKKTVMVPPAYTPSEMGYTVSRDGKYGHEDDVNVRGSQGEKAVYDCLREVGRAKNVGMFVIHGFKLKDIRNWNERCQKEGIESIVPSHDIPDHTGESDFIIFHHEKGAILIEVKNLKESDTSAGLSKKKNTEIDKAKVQLNKSREVVKAFAAVNSGTAQSVDFKPFPVTMFIALPSTKRGTLHKLVDDTSFIYEEDLRSPKNFTKWWDCNIEKISSMATSLETKAYELALSRMLAVRHLGPVTESEYTADTSYTLDNFRHLDNLAKRFRRIKETEHSYLFRWCQDMSQGALLASKVSKGEAFDSLKSLNISAAEGNLIKTLDKHLSDNKFLRGSEPAAEDSTVFQYLSQEYILDIDSIVKFMNRVTEAERQKAVTDVENRTLKDFDLEETNDVSCLNKLSTRLAKNQSGFLIGNCCTNLDVELCDNLAKGDIRVLPMTGKRLWAPVFTAEQLAVFEGPMRQLIIGGPGSGKTEIMKAKALTLSQQSKGAEKILYLIQLPAKTVLPGVVDKFFKDNKANVDVVTIELEGENYEVFESQCSQLRERLESKMYSHVFIDELWIGSKIRYQVQQDGTVNMVDELAIVKQAIESIKGYVWMSSVFDFKEECFEEISEEDIEHVLAPKRLKGEGKSLYKKLGTPSLLETLRRNGGVTRRIKHVLRSTNNIVKLLQDYSARYLERDFPYGTENMLNHNVEGQDISWIVFQPLEQGEPWQVRGNKIAMLTYSKCVEVIKEAIRFYPALRPPSLMKTGKNQVRKLRLCLNDILVVNFVARYQSKLKLGEELKREGIVVCDLQEQGALSGGFLDQARSGVCLLNSGSRRDSTCLDGAEWPMVIVLLTSELMLNEGNAPFETVRNYDPYIAMFRAQAKLVVISDSWRSSEDFLESVDKKSR